MGVTAGVLCPPWRLGLETRGESADAGVKGRVNWRVRDPVLRLHARGQSECLDSDVRAEVRWGPGSERWEER